MDLQVIGTKVLLKSKDKETVSKGGIYIPENAGDKPQEATVIAVGPGTNKYSMTVKINDTVLHGKYAGTEIKINSQPYLIMDETDILLILGDNND